MAEVDPDIISKTKKFIDQHETIGGRLTQNEKSELVHWLQTEILFERQGWKAKLDAALRQSEIYRKDALRWETVATEQESMQEDILEENEEDGNEEKTLIDELQKQLIRIQKQSENIIDDNRQLIKSLKKRLTVLEEKNQTLMRDKRLCMTLLKVDVPEKKAEINRILRNYMNQMEQKLKQSHQFENNNEKQVEQLFTELHAVRQDKNDLLQETLELREAIRNLEISGKFGNGLTVVAYQDKNSLQQQRQVRMLKTVEDMKLILHERAQQIFSQTEAIEELTAALSGLEAQLQDKDKLISRYEKQIQTMKHQLTYGGHGETVRPVDELTERDRAADLPSFHPLSQSHREGQQYSSLPSLGFGNSITVNRAARKSLPHAMNAHSQKEFSPAKTAVTRCLRCNKLYRLMDNNKLACRYHSKPKRKVEHYSPSGKIVDIFYLWSCCDKTMTADGCCASQHV